jgi:hypothetical protein
MGTCIYRGLAMVEEKGIKLNKEQSESKEDGAMAGSDLYT